MPWPSETSRDTETFGYIDEERGRQITGLQLIASENFTSPDVMAATGSVLTNKYAEGYPTKRYYGGNAVVDKIEALAIERVKKLFGADHANVQPHSGASANMAVYLGLLNPGDTVLGLSLDHGGHLTHGSPVNASGILYNFKSFRVGDTDERLDFDQIRELALEHRPKMIVAGTTSYPRRLEPEPFKAIADEVGALMMFDIAHIAGLVAGGAHPNPVPFADVVTFTTHKTLRGPRGGCILSSAAHAAAIDKAVFPGSQGGPLEHAVAAKSVAFHEAIPGHHLDRTIAVELQDVPDFQRYVASTAFVEGWGLYSEQLANEMGLYSNDVQQLGRLGNDAWRACRLVLDTGMHGMGWSRDKAVEFFRANSPIEELNANVETDRYIAWPGQACSYKMGQLKIEEQRRKAEDALGENFDIRYFHDEVLCDGGITLPILENKIDAFITKHKS